MKSFEHKKSLGQHFLNSDYVPKKMCDAVDLAAGEIVFEIGPGTGALTREILTRGGKVVAIEADLRAIASLQESFPDELADGTLTVHHMDARMIDFAALGLQNQQFKVIANIPYYISGLLFRQCLESDIQPTDLVFLVQKEVAERIARDKKESILSLSVKAFGEPSYICTVKRTHFTPPPAVDSAVIAVRNINQANFTNISTQQFFDVLHLGFGQKRKQLAGNLRRAFPQLDILRILSAQQLRPDVRAEDLTIADFLQLTAALYQS